MKRKSHTLNRRDGRLPSYCRSSVTALVTLMDRLPPASFPLPCLSRILGLDLVPLAQVQALNSYIDLYPKR